LLLVCSFYVGCQSLCEKVIMPLPSRAPRRRGAQPNNFNALKHGLFARKGWSFSVLVPTGAPLKKDLAPVALTHSEETELLRTLFSFMLGLYPEVNDFINVFPIFRKFINIVFLQASIVRACHPLSIADRARLAAILGWLLSLN
jgi:hypothetical protein